MGTEATNPTPSGTNDCSHAQALRCDEKDLHEANRISVFFYCVECGAFLDDTLVEIACDPMQEAYSPPRSEAGKSPAVVETVQKTQGQPQKLPNSLLRLAGVQNGLPMPPTGLQGLKLLPINPSTFNQNGTGPIKTTKTPSTKQKEIKPIEDDEKYGKVLPGPWQDSLCPNSRLHPGPNGCPGTMKAYYTLEFGEDGNSYMYQCSDCGVYTAISFQKCKIKYND